MKPRIKYNFEFQHLKIQGQKFTQPSMTIPDQTMSIPELIRRYAQGLPLGAPRVPIYEGEDDPMQGVNFKKLDLSEQMQQLTIFSNEIKETTKRINASKKNPISTENVENNTNDETLR
jgi:hypothetical protein